MICPHCATATVPGAAYCQSCGHDLAGFVTPLPHSASTAEPDAMDTPEAVSQRMADSEFVFFGWVLSLIVLVLAWVIYRKYGTFNPVLMAGLFVVYLWVFLLVRLEQLAQSIGKWPVSWVYSSLMLPVLGNFISFYFLYRSAKLKMSVNYFQSEPPTHP
jgi:hypothetical protein